MLNALKNAGLTAVFVIVATMATTAAAAVACLLWAWSQAGADPGSSALLLSGAAVAAGALFGTFFSVVSLAVAALTMPPALVLMRALKLPRPLFDCLGGGAAGLICSAAAMSVLESLARSKGGGAPGDDLRMILDICGMVGGGLLGYLRQAVLVRQREALPPSSLAYAP